MSAIKVEISRNIIKPSSPTPQSLKNFKLSLIDQLVPPVYLAVIFFYPSNINNNPNGDSSSKVADLSRCLQESLSKTLTLFYPMAGQVKDPTWPTSIDCNDSGAHFFEARVQCKLAEILSQPNPELLNQYLLPNDPETIESCSGAVLRVQLSSFDCGGVAIGVCTSHKLGDFSTLCTFLKCWTAISSGSDEVDSPEFIGASLLPPTDFPAKPASTGKYYITRRFVFEGSKIATLGEKINIEMRQPSREELVSALFFKCAVAASRSISGSPAPAVLLPAVDLRNWMDPQLPENSLGNIVWTFPVFIEEGDEVELQELTAKISKGMTEFCNEKASKFKGHEGFLDIMDALTGPSIARFMAKEIYKGSNWCRSGVLYETDFGWGKPAWVGTVIPNIWKGIVLLDTKEDDGIEAWVTLDEPEMALFQLNQELLEFATLNPSVLV